MYLFAPFDLNNAVVSVLIPSIIVLKDIYNPSTDTRNVTFHVSYKNS